VRPGEGAVAGSGAAGDTAAMMATAVGLLLLGVESADQVTSLVPGSATPATGVGSPRGSPTAPFWVVGEAMSMSESTPMFVVGSAVRYLWSNAATLGRAAMLAVAGGDTRRAVPRAVSLLWGVPVTTPVSVFSAGAKPGAGCVELPSPARWDLPPPPSVAAFSGSGGVSTQGVLLVAALGRGLAVARAGLGLAMAGGVERPPKGARRGRPTGGPVLGVRVPWARGSGDGPAVTISWLGAGPAALSPGFSSVPTSRDAVPTACPVVLPSGCGSPEAPFAGGGVAGDSGDTPRAIPAVALPSRRGGEPALDATGMLAALGTPGVPGTAVPSGVLGDHVSALGAAPCWGPVQRGGAGAGPGVTPVPEGAASTAGPGWPWLGDTSGTAGVAPESHSIVVAFSVASDAAPVPASLVGELLTREDGWAAGPALMPYTPREDVGAAAARGAPSGFAPPAPRRDKDVAMVGLAEGDPSAATSAVVVPGPAEGF